MKTTLPAGLLLSVLLAGCAAPTPPTAPEVSTLQAQAAACPAPGTARQLARATDGLLYMSETDAPLSLVRTPYAQMPTPAQVPALAGIPAEVAEVETRQFSAFFDRLTTVYDPGDPVAVDTARKFARLRRVLERSYSSLTVYRVRDAVDNPAVWHIFILGVDRCGVSGLRTLAVET